MDAIVRPADPSAPLEKSMSDDSEATALSPSTDTPKKESIFQRFRSSLVRRKLPRTTESGDRNQLYKFAPGNRVYIYTVDNVPVKGTVRWTGPVKSKVAGGNVITVTAVGIELVCYNINML